MKVLVVGPYPVDPRKISGGVEAVTVNLVKELAKRDGLSVVVVCFLPNITDSDVKRREGVTIYYLPQQRRFGNLLFNRFEHARLLKVIDAEKPDMVHFQDLFLVPKHIVREGRPFVTTLHGIKFKEARFTNGFTERARGIITSLFERHQLRLLTNIIAINPYVREVLDKKLSARVWDIPNPVHPDFFTVKRDPDPDLILSVSYINRRKNVLGLLEAFRIAQAARKSLRLKIAGRVTDNKYFIEVLDYIVKHGLSYCVKFEGEMEESLLIEEYAKCSMLVLASLQETAPMCLLQALAAGVPSVATDICGNPHIIENGVTGFLIPPRKYVPMAEKILTLSHDPVLAARIGQAAKERARQTLKTNLITDRTISLYNEILNTRQGG